MPLPLPLRLYAAANGALGPEWVTKPRVLELGRPILVDHDEPIREATTFQRPTPGMTIYMDGAVAVLPTPSAPTQQPVKPSCSPQDTASKGPPGRAYHGSTPIPGGLNALGKITQHVVDATDNDAMGDPDGDFRQQRLGGCRTRLMLTLDDVDTRIAGVLDIVSVVNPRTSPKDKQSAIRRAYRRNLRHSRLRRPHRLREINHPRFRRSR